MKSTKDLNYYKNNCEEDYLTTPISVLRYITELEQALQLLQPAVISSLPCHHNFIQKDTYWKSCTHCGTIAPLGQ